jgi:hypothetical protein
MRTDQACAAGQQKRSASNLHDVLYGLPLLISREYI